MELEHYLHAVDNLNEWQPLISLQHVRVVMILVAAVKGVLPILPNRSFSSRQLYVG